MAGQTVQPYALTIDNAARFSGLSRSRIYELMGAGDLKSFKVGNRRMIMLDDMKAFLDQAAHSQAK